MGSGTADEDLQACRAVMSTIRHCFLCLILALVSGEGSHGLGRAETCRTSPSRSNFCRCFDPAVVPLQAPDRSRVRGRLMRGDGWPPYDRESEEDEERERMLGREEGEEGGRPHRGSRHQCLRSRESSEQRDVFCRTKRYAGRGNFPCNSEGAASESLGSRFTHEGSPFGIRFRFQAQIPYAVQTTELRSEFLIL